MRPSTAFPNRPRGPRQCAYPWHLLPWGVPSSATPPLHASHPHRCHPPRRNRLECGHPHPGPPGHPAQRHRPVAGRPGRQALVGEPLPPSTQATCNARTPPRRPWPHHGAPLTTEPGLRERSLGTFGAARLPRSRPSCPRTFCAGASAPAPHARGRRVPVTLRVTASNALRPRSHKGMWAGAGGDGGAWRRLIAVPPGHAPGHPGAAHLATRERRHQQPPVVDA